MNLHIAGRGKLTAEVSCDFDGVSIRIDDERRPEFWAAIRIGLHELEQLLAEVRGDQVYGVSEPLGYFGEEADPLRPEQQE